MSKYQDYLNGADFSSPMTTDKKHIKMLCELVENKSMKVLELGSYQGISTAAMAIASPDSEITSVDLSDHISSEARLKYWKSLGIENILAITLGSNRFLPNCGKYDLIFHDAVHGNNSMPEYITCASKCKILCIHDFEQLSDHNRSLIKSLFSECVEDFDDSGRCLFIGLKRE